MKSNFLKTYAIKNKLDFTILLASMLDTLLLEVTAPSLYALIFHAISSLLILTLASSNLVMLYPWYDSISKKSKYQKFIKLGKSAQIKYFVKLGKSAQRH